MTSLYSTVDEVMGKTPTDFGSLEQEKSIVYNCWYLMDMDIDIQVLARHFDLILNSQPNALRDDLLEIGAGGVCEKAYLWR
ncbi:1361_t:CDS:2 [Paraglomus occultum]|uniref:1361_t:CDS:1 n=1 Tax=Paraglomus occultum TaxID=144539 RepID=A0A9N8WS39_9GLOM|nr:1361_t:CDS:2 [Paraglomus occultum]